MSWKDAPFEIMSQVFILALPSDLSSRAKLLSIRQYQVLLGSICGSWREISHAVPQLWATHLINGQFNEDNVETIDGGDPSIAALEKQVFWEEMLRRGIDRSGSRDLSVGVHHRPRPVTSGTQRDPGRVASELSAKSRALLVEMLPRIHDLYMDLPNPSPGLSLFFPIVAAPRLRRFHFRHNGHYRLASSLFAEQSTVPLEELGLVLFSPARITLPPHLVRHLRCLDLVTTIEVQPIIFTPHTAQPSISENRDSMITTAEAALSEYQKLENVRLSGVDQRFLEIQWPSPVKSLHIRVSIFDPAGRFHPTLSTDLVHLSLVFSGFRDRPLDEHARWSSDLGLPVLSSLRTFRIEQDPLSDYGENIEIQNWILRRAPNLQVLEIDESLAMYVVNKCADSEFTFAPSESWFSSLLLWRITFRLRGAGPSLQYRPKRIMAEDRTEYWRRFVRKYEGPVGPQIQWGVKSGETNRVLWFGHELPDACWDLAATLPPLSNPNNESSLEETWETLCQSS